MQVLQGAKMQTWKTNSTWLIKILEKKDKADKENLPENERGSDLSSLCGGLLFWTKNLVVLHQGLSLQDAPRGEKQSWTMWKCDH